MIVLRWLFFFLKVLWVVLVYAGKGLSLVLRAARTDFRTQGALGTARWATAWEKFSYGVYRGVGPVVGTGSFGRLMRFNRDGIVQVFASPGAGIPRTFGCCLPATFARPCSTLRHPTCDTTSAATSPA
jgi:hypothetical protein